MDYKQAAEYCVKNMMPNLSVFVGAGLSVSAGLPSWHDLVKPLADELDIPLNGIPLERALEYICGESKSKYSMLIYELKKKIAEAHPQASHYLISQLNLRRIWTTNYDDLLEKAFQQSNYDLEVVTNDDQWFNVDSSKHQLIKMHGSLSSISDNYDDIVLLESQYEKFEHSRRRIFEQLKQDICNKSFLFFGVSFNDINMRRLWASIWNQRKAGHPSMLFTVPPTNDDEKKIYKFWKKDIERYGIEVIELTNYSEINEFLKRISIKHSGKIIAGMGIYKDDTFKELCTDLGGLLAENGYTYHSGGGKNISDFIAQGMWDRRPEIKNDLDRIVFYYRENGGSTNPQKGKVIYVGENYTEMRRRLISPEKLCLLLGESNNGQTGLLEEVRIAREKKCNILAIPFTGSISEETYNQEATFWRNFLKAKTELLAKYNELPDLAGDPKKASENVIELINYYFDNVTLEAKLSSQGGSSR